MRKIYLIKNPAPWMLDELEEFLKYTDYELFFLRQPGSFYSTRILSRIEASGVPVHVLNYNITYLRLKKILFVLRFVFDNFRLFFRNKYSFVVGAKSLAWFLFMDLEMFKSRDTRIHAQFATQAPLIALLVKLYFKQQVSYSFTFHAYDIYFDNAWFNLLSQHSSAFFSISDFNMKYVRRNYVGADFDKMQLSRLGALRHESHLSNHNLPLTIGLISWFQEKKGISYLLSALANLKNKGVDFKFLLAGDGPLKEHLLNQIAILGLENKVNYLGPLDKDQKEAFFRSLDVFVLPAIQVPNDMDGIPVVLMEAVSYAVPLISTNVSGIPEICIHNQNGFLVPEKSVAALESSIESIISTRDLLSRFSLGANAVFELFDIEKNSVEKLKKMNWIN